MGRGRVEVGIWISAEPQWIKDVPENYSMINSQTL